jgi:hypothetical protein
VALTGLFAKEKLLGALYYLLGLASPEKDSLSSVSKGPRCQSSKITKIKGHSDAWLEGKFFSREEVHTCSLGEQADLLFVES